MLISLNAVSLSLRDVLVLAHAGERVALEPIDSQSLSGRFKQSTLSTDLGSVPFP